MSTEDQKRTDVNLTRRKVLTGATGVVGAIGAGFMAVPFIGSWMPSERAKAAGAPVDADISQLQPGQMLTVSWRGKPVWIVRRTPEMLKILSENVTNLLDPDSENSIQPEYTKNPMRAVNEEFLVVVGICTHLGCAPLYRPAVGSPDMQEGWKGGFFCPCHGSSFDLAGRVVKSVPAPTNLEIPPYHFLSNNIIRVGEDPVEGGTA